MRVALELLRRESRARLLLAAHAQSSLGTGAAYVALLLIAYERFHSPWAISLILLADFLPGALLGPVLGAAADRWPRRACMIASDVLRAGAFAGIALSGSFELTLALAVLAGTGTALYKPAVMASLPSLVERDRLPAMTSLYGAVYELGFTVGPALAGAAMLFTGADVLLAANAATYLVSAAVLTRIDFGRTATAASSRSSLLADTRAGLSALRGLHDIRMLMMVCAGLMAVAAVMNVGEMLLATDAFGAGETGFSVIVVASGAGIVIGSMLNSGGGSSAVLKRRFLAAMALQGVALAVAGLTPVFVVAVMGFFVAGVANGLQIATSRVLIQTSVRDELLGRIFGLENAIISAAFVTAFVSGGALLAAFGPRALIAGAGVATMAIWVLASLALREAWRAPVSPRAEAIPAV